MKKLVLFAVIFLLARGVAFAQASATIPVIQTAYDLREQCRFYISVTAAHALPTDGTFPALQWADAAHCSGFVAGWLSGVNGMYLLDENGTPYRFRFDDSISSPVGVDKAVRTFVAYLDKHPEELTGPLGKGVSADTVLAHAMNDAGLMTTTHPSAH